MSGQQQHGTKKETKEKVSLFCNAQGSTWMQLMMLVTEVKTFLTEKHHLESIGLLILTLSFDLITFDFQFYVIIIYSVL